MHNFLRYAAGLAILMSMPFQVAADVVTESGKLYEVTEELSERTSISFETTVTPVPVTTETTSVSWPTNVKSEDFACKLIPFDSAVRYRI